MSGPQKDAPEKSVQDFLQRWSRRKLGLGDADDRSEAPAPVPPQGGEAEPPQPAGIDQSPASGTAFDPARLPPIETIDATTDIRPFLAPGVPVELTRAALRRAWTSDPAIRDFVGLAENQWDFTKPDTVPGFGSLELTEQVREMVAQLFGEMPAETPQSPVAASETAAAEQTEPTKIDAPASSEPALAAAAAAPTDAPPPAGCDPPVHHAALQNDACGEEPPAAWPRHGTALPK